MGRGHGAVRASRSRSKFLCEWWLSAGLRERATITLAVTVFAAVWVAVLAGRVYRGDRLALRTLRLRYRYSALIIGLVIFVAATR